MNNLSYCCKAVTFTHPLIYEFLCINFKVVTLYSVVLSNLAEIGKSILMSYSFSAVLIIEALCHCLPSIMPTQVWAGISHFEKFEKHFSNNSINFLSKFSHQLTLASVTSKWARQVCVWGGSWSPPYLSWL